MSIIHEGNGVVLALRGIFDNQSLVKWETALAKQICFPNKRPIILHGPEVPEPRDVAYFADHRIAALRYGPLRREAQSFPPILLELRAILQQLPICTWLGRSPNKENLNAVLVNYYKNGKDSMGLHRDDDVALGEDPFIVSMSFDATCMMIFQHTDGQRVRVNLTSGVLESNVQRL